MAADCRIGLYQGQAGLGYARPGACHRFAAGAAAAK
jgi:hypothetical protein